jgi:hypothetical protein
VQNLRETKKMRKYFINMQKENKVCKTQPENRRINGEVNGEKRKASESTAVVLVQSCK